MPKQIFKEDDVLALVRLVAAGGASAPRRRLLQQCDEGPAQLSALGLSEWRQAGLDESQIAALRQQETQPKIHQALQWLRAPQRHLLGWHDPDYPPLLRRIPSPPLALFVDGDASLLWRPAVAVVGSRAATVGGCDNARAFAHTIARAGWVVASGLAAGIDAAAHQGALSVDNGLTVAVLGTGPDIAYPRTNTGLMRQIASRGAVVSEHLPGTGPQRLHFPSRNRLLAGLCLGTVVIEAAERSGALITARQAAEAGREVFAVPGSIHNPQTRGCHRLIRDGVQLVESPEEIVQALSGCAAEMAQTLQVLLTDPISQPMPIHAVSQQPTSQDADCNTLWQALGYDPTPMDQLAERTALTAAQLSSMLLLMELDGRVVAEHGRYARKHAS